MTTLLPCPFCGGAKLEVFANVVACEECEAKGPCSQEGPEFTMNPHIRDQDWNRRSDERDGWRPIETAPKDGTEFIAWDGKYAFRCHAGRHYVKWPHEEGGPTYRDVWNGVYYDSIVPEQPTHWQPLPSPPGASE